MQDLFHLPIPSCFSAANRLSGNPRPVASRPSKSAVTSVYSANIAGRRHLITVSWCRNLLAHRFSVSVEGSDGSDGGSRLICKVEMQPWHFWRRQGTRRFDVEGTPVDVLWDLKAAKFANDDPRPSSDYFVAVVCCAETVLLLGDLRRKAQRWARPPPVAEPAPICRKDHVFGKKSFSTRADFDGRGGRSHEIAVEFGDMDAELVVKINGDIGVQVSNLQWKFRGNACVWEDEAIRLEVYWDVHDWLFGHGLRHALFIFKPAAAAADCLLGGEEGSSKNGDERESTGFCLLLYAWRVE